jgi:hypothetical protein
MSWFENRLDAAAHQQLLWSSDRIKARIGASTVNSAGVDIPLAE